ncbi:hypothetical protein PLESTM_001757100 [Pleodorina starrii]|nr:hypothetical protein PLESTM_001757100 [Pleodorina starrii]
METAADLLFDFEETNQDNAACAETSLCKNAALEALAQRVEIAALRHPSELGRQLHRDVIALLGGHSINTCSCISADAFYRLASGLAVQGYDVNVRRTLGGGSSECFKTLRHEFLVVRGTGEFRGMEFIVEPSLRQHFLIPHPSPEYEYVLSRTPDVFVGGSCRLAPLVQLLCALMADSFQRQDQPLPPWRTEAAMLSKWLPNPARMLDLSPCLAVNDPQHPLVINALQDCNAPQLNLAGEAPTPAVAAAGAPGTCLSPRRLSVLSWVPVDTAGAADAAPCPLTAAVVVGFDVCDQAGLLEGHDYSRTAAAVRRCGAGRPTPTVNGREKDQQRCVGAAGHGRSRRRRRSGVGRPAAVL